MFADPAKVHKVRHDGQYHKLDAIHLSEPSLQRTAVLYQAGASGRGRDFAAAHAECVFINGPSKQVAAPYVAGIRRRAAQLGRSPDDVAIFTLTTVIVGRTEAEARAKHADYRNYIDHEASLALLFGWTGIDFSKYRLSDPLRHVQTEAMRSAVESFTSADPNRVWTVGELAEHVGIGGRGPVLVGSPEQVADELQAWAEATGVDGFNLAYAATPESFEDFVDLVVPVLQRRGVFKTDHRPGTLREKLFGTGQARLLPTHPGARFRFWPADG